jgi:glycosyltransferase involved in cell wall biosynthesis
MSYSSNSLPQIAWLSPLPPQRSGIANYSYWLIHALKTYFDIHLYYDGQAPLPELRKEFQVYPLSAFPARYESYLEAVYHLGNHTGFHREIYKLAWEYPGTVVLHDYNLAAFMHDAFYCRNDEELYQQTLFEGYGDGGRQEFAALREGLIPYIARFPMSHAVVSRSRKTVVHHRWIKNQFAEQERVEVIPHFARVNHRPTFAEIESFKKRFHLKDNHFVISCLGFVNSNKLPGLQIAVAKRLVDDGYPVQLVFAGEPAPDVKGLEEEAQKGLYSENIIFTGYQNEADYFSAIFASDVIINLRNPSMGEASGTLMHALAAARPTIISDANQYREFPDKVCWKLTHDENQLEVLYAYLAALLTDKNLRAAISKNSAEYIESVFAWEKIIARWTEVILG